ncbi:16S rRNA methyltransferase, partial [Francisella tularensis subsp. holarctica]|nr:16S rRNA methyltransferase [Francisella tularensis subsp. holarctica]
TKTTIYNISGEYYNYIKNMLLLKKSYMIELFNNTDSLQYKTKIITIDNKNITLEVIDKKHSSNENNSITSLSPAILKSE